MPAPKTSPFTGNREVPGFDFAWTKPDPATMAAAGYAFALGYASHDAGKNLTAAVLAAYRAHGLAVGLVFEDTAGRAGEGAAAGATDGATAEAQANAIGYPSDAVIFFAVDFDAQPGSWPALQAYAAAFNAATSRPVGAYGGRAVVDLLVTPGVPPVRYGWQTAAWSGGLVSAKAHIYQRVGHPGWPVPAGIDGNGFDENVLLKPLPLTGWQGVAPPPPPPPPPPAHPSILAWSLPAGHFYGNLTGPATSHGGVTADERTHVENIQRWLVYHGCTPVPARQWAITAWADGKWQDPTDAAMALWHARSYPGQPEPKQCWADDYHRLAVA